MRITCPQCQGSGRIPEFPHDFGVGEPCPQCREDGWIDVDACAERVGGSRP